jgi:hypothetical protein
MDIPTVNHRPLVIITASAKRSSFLFFGMYSLCSGSDFDSANSASFFEPPSCPGGLATRPNVV